MGAKSHYLILNYIQELQGSIVEIGSSREDGSTDFFAGLVYGIKDLDFYTIDFDNDQFDHASSLSKNIKNMKAHCMLGEDFLTNIFPGLNKEICWAYLDNYDWNWFEENNEDLPDWIINQIQKYKDNNLEYSNKASQQSHLIQAQLVHKFAAKKCFIHFDDTWRQNQTYNGKGGTAVPWLLENNWKVVDTGKGSYYMILSNSIN